MKKLILLLFIPLVFACGGSEEKNSNSLNLNSDADKITDPMLLKLKQAIEFDVPVVENNKLNIYRYYESGAIKYIRPKEVDGKLQGEWIDYYEWGGVKFKINYVDDKVQGEVVNYYESGVVKSIDNYVDGLLQGEMISYYESGAVKRTANYVDGLQQGEAIMYYESGAIESKINYVDDKVQGEVVSYYESGAIKWKVNYVDGVIIKE